MKKNIFIFMLILNFLNLYGADLTLDTSFNATGIKTITGYNGGLQGANVAIRTDGKIVTFGTNTTTSVTAIFTVDANGSSFTQFDVGNSTESFKDILIQPDGKYIIVGNNTTTGFAIMRRYVVDETGTGTPDSSFGAGGLVTTADIGQAYNAILQPDLKIILSIKSNMPSPFFLIRRYNQDGTLETSFAETFPGASLDIVQQADGKVIVAGTNTAFDIARFNTTGTLDGTITFSNAVAGSPSSINILPDGQIIVAGTDTTNFVIAKYSTLDGSIIASNSTVPGFEFFANSLNLSPNGKPIFLGYTTDTTFFKIARYNTGLTLDTSDETLVPGFGEGASIQSNGYIVAVGEGQTAPFPITIARYVNNNPLATTAITSPSNGSTITEGKVTFSGTAQNPSNVYLYIDGVFSEGTVTDASGSNTWIIDPILAPGVHTAQVVSIYKNHKLNIASDLITFTVEAAPIPPAPTPTPTPSNIILAPTFTGTLIFNQFLNKTERIVFAQWPVDPTAVLYKIYKRNQLLTIVRPNGSSILRQAIYLQPCDKISDFSLSFVNTSGIESEKAILQLTA